MLNQSKIWAVALLLTVFVAGAAIGGPAWGAFRDEPPGERDGRRGSSESRERERKSYSEHLQEELGLSAEQRSAIDSILDLQQAEMRIAWRQMRAQLDTLRQNISVEIMTFLDEEQQAQYREMIERSRNKGDRDRDRRNHR